MKEKIAITLLAIALAGTAVYSATQIRKQKATIVELTSKVDGLTKAQEEAKKATEQQAEESKASTNSDFASQLKSKDLSQYQAVHKTDGQTYFGKITSYGSDYIVLEDIYYLQTSGGSDSMQSSITLVKLGSEIHAPEDKMTINVASIDYVETMKEDSQVLRAIIQDKQTK